MSCTEAQKRAAKNYYERNKDKCREIVKKWKEQNKERDSNNRQKWRLNNPERIKQSRENNIETMLYISAKARAAKANMEFTITKDDIKIPEVCTYLKYPITRKLGAGRIKTNPSLDRIDSTKGYSKNNIQVISNLANRMKSNATKEELIQFSKSVLEMEGYIISDGTNNTQVIL